MAEMFTLYLKDLEEEKKEPLDGTFKKVFFPQGETSAYLSIKLFFFYCEIKLLCSLQGRKGRGGQGGRQGGVPSPASRHQVLRRQRHQGPAETEEGLGDPAHQRGGELSRTVPSDARQRK